MRYLKMHQVRPGMVTASPLYNNEGRMLLAANCQVTCSIAARLYRLGYPGIFVLDGDEDAAFKPFLDESVRLEAVKSLKSLDLDAVVYVANAISNQVMFGSGALYDMDVVCGYDTMTYMHSVNVTILSVMTGIGMGLGNEELIRLGQAALLHDIGKTGVDPRIIKKPGKLTKEEFDEVRRHPVYGYEMLKKAGCVPESVMLAVAAHHENEDGSGYPYNLKSDEIPLHAKIIHVADVYDALVSRRSYKKSMNPADALENLMGGVGSMFDFNCVCALRDSIALYPVGSEVVLSSGMHAWVQENHAGYPTRPLLRTATGLRINLMDKLSLTIVRFADGSGPMMAVA